MNILVRLQHQLETRRAVVLIVGLLLLHTALHVKYINLPPVGFHQWRQTQTLAVARNFYEEGMNILEPRVDSRGQYSGITGVEFPVVNYAIAAGYKLFGFHPFVERTVLLLFSFIGIVGCFFFLKELFGKQWLGFAGAFFLTFSPLYSYYSIVVLPDEPSVALMFVALFFLVRDSKSDSTAPSVGFLIALTLAALVKIYAFILLVPAAFYYLYRQPIRSARLKNTVLLGLSFLIVLGWYLYARYLSEVHHNFDFRLESNFPYSIALIPQVLRKVFVQWLPELYINYPAFVFFLVGCYALRRAENHGIRTLLALYLIPFAVYFVFFLPMFDIHDYYAIPALPVLVVITTLGLQTVAGFATRKRWVPVTAIVVLAVVPLVGSIRALSRFEGAFVDPELMSIEHCLDAVVPDRKALVIAAHDASPSIYLYFMHRKGWHATESVSSEAFEGMIRDGARYLVSDSRSLEGREEINRHLAKISSCGRFNVFALRE
ncbi:MAG TPA: glycosyltransferase family 39 protein [Bacteroidota bacterium]